jgi:hypothetical protein
MHLADLIPDADAILNLEPEELGLLILKVLDSWSPHTALQLSTFLGTTLGQPHISGSGPYPATRRGELRDALCTAWAWLEGQALLIPDTRYSEGVVKLSQLGKKVANDPQVLIRDKKSRSALSARVPKKPVADAVAECLKEEGLDHGRGERSYESLAHAIAPCMSRRLKKSYNTAAGMEALTKAVLRHFSGHRK